MEEEVKNYLGIDWGSSKIGLALADSETKMAFAYATLKNDCKDKIGEIVEIIKRENVGTVVIGIPSYINRRETVYPGEKMGTELKNKIEKKIKIVYQNEMFSTQIAHRNLIERGVKRIGKFDDAESARVILESYLGGVR
ncbi:MAG: Holliday junction resolvase RuvX [Sphingobacteriia bacterium]|nr:Holliday junction resolvase RuvX [Sphingobacteriia bacterium]